ncbi:hypothetical protein DL93DRAFT_745756 [Clavulina sp. PMI_390]|nr:hypothetical protein DL93DRAFT_745756 [Clavulina sp. PMI_390]
MSQLPSPLHVAYTLKNQKAFRQLLDRANAAGANISASNASGGGGGGGTGTSSSGPRSWTLHSILGGAGGTTYPLVVDVNAKDSLGRTVLHRLCSSLEPGTVDYLRMLLAHPALNVNVTDLESRWTPLHRALYTGNIVAAVLLLQRSDVDITFKDQEGHTAFDVYNSTVENTKPGRTDGPYELFTWGANRCVSLSIILVSSHYCHWRLGCTRRLNHFIIFHAFRPFLRRIVVGAQIWRRRFCMRTCVCASSVCRNAALGHGDANDRAFPDLVNIPKAKSNAKSGSGNGASASRLHPLQVKTISMSKLHTALITAESRANLRLCGFGSSGRLGGTQSTQYSLSPLQHFDTPVIAVACGQDHTLVLNQSNEILSWGLNRFSQLGYVLDSPNPSHSRSEEPIQSSPRKIVGLLKGKKVLGIAACRMASAAWTSTTVYTWGTNAGGQLGYQESVQPTPRAVPTLSLSTSSSASSSATPIILDLALSDTAMACLLAESKDVLIFAHHGHFKVSFPSSSPFANLASGGGSIKPYRYIAPQSGPPIVKVQCCEGTFVALSELGDVWTFGAPGVAGAGTGLTGANSDGQIGQSGMNPTAAGGSGSSGTVGGMTRPKWIVKPQRVWALRKQMSAVVDVAPGADGSLILCTESGHVFIRSRISKSSSAPNSSSPSSSLSNLSSQNQKAFRFQRIPFLQRVVRVATNSTGAYAALRADARPEAIAVVGNTVSEDMGTVRPFVVHRTLRSLELDDGVEMMTSLEDKLADLELAEARHRRREGEDDGDDEEDEATAISASLRSFAQLLGVLDASRSRQGAPSLDAAQAYRAHGADVLVRCELSVPSENGATVSTPVEIPVHRVILESRCPALAASFKSGKALSSGNVRICWSSVGSSKFLDISSCHPLAILVVVQYLYTDDVPAFWDRRVGGVLSAQITKEGTTIPALRAQVEVLARLLKLDPLLDVVGGASQRTPAPTMARDLGALFNGVQVQSASAMPVPKGSSLPYDVLIELADRTVAAHSCVLRARSPMFASFLDDEDWTIRRWGSDGVLKVDFKHLEWRPMEVVFRWMYGQEEKGMFDGDAVDRANNLDEYLDFVFSVLGCATELLLDRLILICSSVIIQHVNVMNACALLADASYYSATSLVRRLQTYMAMNLECLLENRILEDMHIDLVAQLAMAIQGEQAKKLNVSRSNRLVNEALEKHAEWLKLQDIPQPIIRSSKAILAPKHSPRLSPTTVNVGKTPRRSPKVLPGSPPVRALTSTKEEGLGDDIFDMDDDPIPPLSLSSPERTSPMTIPALKETRDSSSSLSTTPTPAPVWRAPSVPASKMDLKTIMAEAAQNSPRLGPSPGTSPQQSKGKARISGFQPASPNPPAPSSSTLSPRDIRRPWGGAETGPIPSPTGITFVTPPANSGPLPSRTPSTSGAFPVLGTLSASRPQLTPSPSASSRDGPSTPRRVSKESLRPTPSAPPTTPSRAPGLGPTITPGRIASLDSGKKRATTDAWTLPPTEPTPPPAAPSGNVTSFAAIQQQQKEALITRPKPKTSLLDIQREEEDIQAEIDFMSWWTGEEERLRQEAAAVAASQAQGQGSGKDKKPNGGRGGKRPSNVKRTKPATDANQAGPSNSNPPPNQAAASTSSPSPNKPKPSGGETSGGRSRGGGRRRQPSGQPKATPVAATTSGT